HFTSRRVTRCKLLTSRCSAVSDWPAVEVPGLVIAQPSPAGHQSLINFSQAGSSALSGRVLITLRFVFEATELKAPKSQASNPVAHVAKTQSQRNKSDEKSHAAVFK
ncbi:hypothetical protein BaRGS_00039060, partial [Batillaria attramentaria]